MMIGPVINVFGHYKVRINLIICDHSIITFRKTVLCVGFSNTYHVDSLDIFSKLVVEKVHNSIDNLKGGNRY